MASYYGPGSTGASPPPGYQAFNPGQPTAYTTDPRTGAPIPDYSKPFSGTLSQAGLPGAMGNYGTWSPMQGGGGYPGYMGGSQPGTGTGSGLPGGAAPYGPVGPGQLAGLLGPNPTAEDLQGNRAAGMAFQEYERLPGLYQGGMAGQVGDAISRQLSGQDSPFTPGVQDLLRGQYGDAAAGADRARQRMIGDSAASRGITGGAQLGMQLQSQEQAAQQFSGQNAQLGITSALENFGSRERGRTAGQAFLGEQAAAMTPAILAKGSALANFQNFGDQYGGLGRALAQGFGGQSQSQSGGGPNFGTRGVTGGRQIAGRDRANQGQGPGGQGGDAAFQNALARYIAQQGGGRVPAEQAQQAQPWRSGQGMNYATGAGAAANRDHRAENERRAAQGLPPLQYEDSYSGTGNWMDQFGLDQTQGLPSVGPWSERTPFQNPFGGLHDPMYEGEAPGGNPPPFIPPPQGPPGGVDPNLTMYYGPGYDPRRDPYSYGYGSGGGYA